MKVYKFWLYKFDRNNSHVFWIVMKDEKIWYGPGYDCKAKGQFWQLSEEQFEDLVYDWVSACRTFSTPGMPVIKVKDLVEKSSPLELVINLGAIPR